MSVDIRELMLTGAHFGHRARFWNPQMAEYIYGEYHSTHIINLDMTVQNLQKAADFLRSVAATGGTVLYLCTKDAGAEALRRGAEEAGMPFVNRRWLGGILTNFKTTRNSVDTLVKMEGDRDNGALKYMTKKEGIKFLAALDKLERVIGGIRQMKEPPEALFVVDAGWHKGAIAEANKLGIPVVAVVDTNHSPLNIDYVIPGNDDSKQAIGLYVGEMTKAVAAGRAEYEAANADSLAAPAPAAEEDARPKPKKVVVGDERGDDKPVIPPAAPLAAEPADAPAPAAPLVVPAAAPAVAPAPVAAAAAEEAAAEKPKFTAADVKALREKTGFGVMECKKALVECGGDMEKARAFLKERSGGKAAGVAGRGASEGRLAFAEKDGVGVLVEGRCETDFVARGDDFAAFVDALAAAAAAVGIEPKDAGALQLAGGKTAEDARKELVMKIGENISIGRLEVLPAKKGGGVASYIHTDKKTGVLLAYEGDGGAAHDVCMHIAAMKPEGEAELKGQAFVKDGKKTVGEMLAEAKTKISAFQLLVVGADE